MKKKAKKIYFKPMSIILFIVLFSMLGVSIAFSKSKLVFMNWDPILQKQQEKFYIERYEKLHPDVEIKGLWIPWSTYWPKVQTMMVTDEQIDVMYFSVAFVEEFAHKGFLTNLQPLVERDIDPEQWYPQAFHAALKYPVATGDLYEFPHCFDANALFYNLDIFDEAGISYPNDNWTWDTLVEAAKKLTFDTNQDGKIDQWGFYSTTNYYFFDHYLASMGQPIFAKDYSRCLLGEPKTIEAVQILVDMIHKDHSAPTKALVETLGDPFQAGAVAMSVWSTWLLQTNQHPPYRWDAALVPKGPAGRIHMGFPNGVVIPKSTKNPEIAWDFIKFICMDKEARIKGDFAGRPPVYKPLALSPEWAEQSLSVSGINSIDNILRSVDYIPDHDPNFFCWKWIKWRMTVMENELDYAFLGEKPVEEACKSAAKKVTELLKERLQILGK